MSADLQTEMAHKRSDEIDTLSSLPDSVISHILSFLPTNNAVATSLLSSRWKFLWMYIDSLNFSEGNKITNSSRENENRLKLTIFVNRVLFMLKSKSINKFSLKMNGQSGIWSSLASTWLTVVIARDPKVLKLKLDFKLDDKDAENELSTCHIMDMPACLFTCKTLTVLKLRCVLNLNVPNYVCLPNVITLELARVNYSSEDSLQRLISGCSSLQTLSIQRVTDEDGVITFTIDSPTLKFLDYWFLCNSNNLGRASLPVHMLEINAPALEYLRLVDNMSYYSIQNLFSLEFAAFQILFLLEEFGDDEQVRHWREVQIVDHFQSVVKLILQVQNVKHLWLNGHTLEALSPVLATPEESYYLRSSELFIRATKSDCNTLQELLESSEESPNLYLSEDPSHFTHLVHWKKPKELPACLLSCLETISVNGFRGQRGELDMLAYILENAEVLRTMTISEATSESNAKFKLREEILKFERGSKMCEIKFS